MFLVADFLFYDPCAVHGDGDRRSSDGIGKCWRCPTHFCLVLVGEWNGVVLFVAVMCFLCCLQARVLISSFSMQMMSIAGASPSFR